MGKQNRNLFVKQKAMRYINKAFTSAPVQAEENPLDVKAPSAQAALLPQILWKGAPSKDTQSGT